MYDPMYDTFSKFQRRDAKELVPYLVSKMSKRNFQTVLDFGCGSGFNTKNILLPTLSTTGGKNNTKIYSVDVSKTMIEFASIKYSQSNLVYMTADVLKEDCEFPCKFDKIFSLHVLHWISDQEKILRSLLNLLKPHGEIAFYYIANAVVFSVYDTMSTMMIWKPYLHDAKKFIPKSYFSSDPARDMHILMTSVGYHAQEATNCTRQFCFDNFSNMIDSAMAANPFFHRIPVHLQDLYKYDFQNCIAPLVHHVPTASYRNSIEVDYDVVVVRARKL